MNGSAWYPCIRRCDASIRVGLYPYTEDLVSLDSMRSPYPIATELSEVVTPLITDEWACISDSREQEKFTTLKP